MDIKGIQINSKFSRIEYIYDRLLKTPSGATISELAYELDVSTKTIQRDLHEVLSDSGVYCDGRKWKLDSSKIADGLQTEERLILGVLDEIAKNVGNSFYNKAHQLLKQVSSQLDHPLFANLNVELLKDEHLAIFKSLEHAIQNKTIINCNYTSKSKRNLEFKLKPLKLAFFDGFWYLLAFDVNHKDEFKKFHLKSISNISQTDEIFNITSEVEDKLKLANSVWFNLDKPFTVRLFVEKEVAVYFERKPFKTQAIESKDKNGSIVVAIDITNEMEILPLILWYMPHIKVLEPDFIAKRLKAKVEDYIKELS